MLHESFSAGKQPVNYFGGDAISVIAASVLDGRSREKWGNTSDLLVSHKKN
jgi:hypothetical protein